MEENTRTKLLCGLLDASKLVPKLESMLRRLRAISILLMMRRDNTRSKIVHTIHSFQEQLVEFEKRALEEMEGMFNSKSEYLDMYRESVTCDIESLRSLSTEVESLLRCTPGPSLKNHEVHAKRLIEVFSLVLSNNIVDLDVDDDIDCLDFVQNMEIEELLHLGKVVSSYQEHCPLVADYTSGSASEDESSFKNADSLNTINTSNKSEGLKRSNAAHETGRVATKTEQLPERKFKLAGKKLKNLGYIKKSLEGSRDLVISEEQNKVEVNQALTYSSVVKCENVQAMSGVSSKDLEKNTEIEESVPKPVLSLQPKETEQEVQYVSSEDRQRWKKSLDDMLVNVPKPAFQLAAELLMNITKDGSKDSSDLWTQEEEKPEKEEGAEQEGEGEEQRLQARTPEVESFSELTTANNSPSQETKGDLDKSGMQVVYSEEEILLQQDNQFEMDEMPWEEEVTEPASDQVVPDSHLKDRAHDGDHGSPKDILTSSSDKETSPMVSSTPLKVCNPPGTVQESKGVTRTVSASHKSSIREFLQKNDQNRDGHHGSPKDILTSSSGKETSPTVSSTPLKVCNPPETVQESKVVTRTVSASHKSSIREFLQKNDQNRDGHHGSPKDILTSSSGKETSPTVSSTPLKVCNPPETVQESKVVTRTVSASHKSSIREFLQKNDQNRDGHHDSSKDILTSSSGKETLPTVSSTPLKVCNPPETVQESKGDTRTVAASHKSSIREFLQKNDQNRDGHHGSPKDILTSSSGKETLPTVSSTPLKVCNPPETVQESKGDTRTVAASHKSSIREFLQKNDQNRDGHHGSPKDILTSSSGKETSPTVSSMPLKVCNLPETVQESKGDTRTVAASHKSSIREFLQKNDQNRDGHHGSPKDILTSSSGKETSPTISSTPLKVCNLPGTVQESKGVTRTVSASHKSSIREFLQNNDQNQDGATVPAKLEVKLGQPGRGSGGCLHFPIGVTTDFEGNILVTDTGNHLVKVFDKEGIFKYTIGDTMVPPFTRPSAIVVNAEGKIFVKDDVCIHKFTCTGKYLCRLGAKKFNMPYGLALTSKGDLVTLDICPGNSRIFIISPDGFYGTCYPFEPLISCGYESKCRFLTVHNDTLYVSDLGCNCVYITDLFGCLRHTIGHSGHRLGLFSQAAGIAVDKDGHIIVADSRNERIQIFRPNGNFLGVLALSDPHIRPSDIHLTPDGRLVIVNFTNHEVRVYRLCVK